MCTEKRVVPDDSTVISSTLRELADSALVDLILTTGGTGLAPRDVTPEASRAIAHREVPVSVRRCGRRAVNSHPWRCSHGLWPLHGRRR